MKVGYIGVGNMGGPMCRNLIKRSNHSVTVFDLNPGWMALDRRYNQPDGIHPNAEGYRVVAETVYSYAVEALRKRP